VKVACTDSSGGVTCKGGLYRDYYLIPMNFLILCIAILSIIIGALGLSNQWRIKRFLAYSSISHIGF
jgi:NADH:ubiquinone oxidoreductase subunit 2 (subunit N)